MDLFGMPFKTFHVSKFVIRRGRKFSVIPQGLIFFFQAPLIP